MTGVATLVADLRRRADPCATFETCVGGPPERWQAGVMSSRASRQVMLCARQVGKSSTIAALVAHLVRFRRDQLVLLFAPVERQSRELLAKVKVGVRRLGCRVAASSATELQLDNGSRVVALPGDSPDTVRSFSAVDLMVFDEAAFVRPEVYTAALPMRSGRGRLILASSPGARDGFLWEAWNNADPAVLWERVRITADESAQYSPERLVERRGELSPREAAVELDCQFAGRADGVFDPLKVEAAFAHTPASIRLPEGVWS
jgi:hypothetical protein